MPETAAPGSAHRWKFLRLGGLDQVQLDTADDLRNLASLDQKLWVALGCPTKGLEIDARTLELLDTDKDGRVRAPDVIAAVQFCERRLKDLGDLLAEKEALPLSAIEERTPEGKALRGAARRILESLGKGAATEVTAADVADTSKVFANTLFNGDGVVTADSAGGGEVKQVILDAMATVGSVPDRSGQPGIDKAGLDAFFAELEAFEAWWVLGRGAEVQVLGAGTPAAADAVRAIRTKVDDYFTRAGLAALDARTNPWVGRTEAEIAALARGELSPASPEVVALPIARIAPGEPLPLATDLNPAWQGALAVLRRDAVVPVFGPDKSSLAAGEWEALKARLAPYEAWVASKKGLRVEKLGATRVSAILRSGGKAAVEALIEEDKAREAEATAVADVVRIVHYRRDLYRLLRNFVSFVDFYHPQRPAVFQAGTLYLDARACHLCVRVDDPGAHAALAAGSRMYIAYCECRRPGGESMKIAACFTQGDSDYLAAGRNGIFYDRSGRDWDATIVRVLDNPISIRQAVFAPYKKFVKMIEEQVAKFAAAKDKEGQARLGAVAERATGAATTGAPPKPEAVDVGKMVGIIAALGVGVGALGTFFGAFVSGFIGLQPWWAKGVAILGAMAAISGPAVVIAWLKLRQRTLGPLLDANGWAVNGRVLVNMALGMVLTDRASLPAGASRSLSDPYADRAARRRRVVFWLVVIAAAVALAVARHLGKWPFAPR
ncbi:MAG TPA: hypothetical protein VMT17_07470 [Anaeromyxobacteraceae bacterium]|nr:hypothetical protein [Anaeromyxobacteraceae bacterium]